jgi:hypothetical protein
MKKNAQYKLMNEICVWSFIIKKNSSMSNEEKKQ